MFGRHFFRGRRFAHEDMEQDGHRHHFGHALRHLRGHHRRRMFDQGDLRLVILKLIQDKPRHGYELIKEIEDRLGGAYSPSPGVVYPTLTLLEELGYTRAADSDGGKKLHHITDDGAAFLETNKAAVEAIFGRMETVGGGVGLRGLQILRAMKNLKSALRARVARGQLDEAQIKAMVAAIDEAAAKIGQI